MSSSFIEKVCTKAQHQVSKDYTKSQKWLADHGGLTSLGEKIVKLRRGKIANTLKENGMLDKEFVSEEEIDTNLENKANMNASVVKESPSIETPIAKENSIVEAPVVKPEPMKINFEHSKTDERSELPAVQKSEEKTVSNDDEFDREAISAARLVDGRKSKVTAAHSKEKNRTLMWNQMVASTSQPLAVRKHYKGMNKKAEMIWEQKKKQP